MVRVVRVMYGEKTAEKQYRKSANGSYVVMHEYWLIVYGKVYDSPYTEERVWVMLVEGWFNKGARHHR